MTSLSRAEKGMAVSKINRQLKIQKGLTNAALTQNKVVITHVDFTTKFAEAPGVTAVIGSEYGESTHAFMANISIAITGVTATGFDIRVGYNGTTGNTQTYVHWTAIGY